MLSQLLVSQGRNGVRAARLITRSSSKVERRLAPQDGGTTFRAQTVDLISQVVHGSKTSD
jgi:hypothetical protein